MAPGEELARKAGSSMGIPDTWRVFEQTSSTNDTIHEAALNGAPEGTIHLARAQTRGRGRLVTMRNPAPVASERMLRRAPGPSPSASQSLTPPSTASSAVCGE